MRRRMLEITCERSTILACSLSQPLLFGDFLRAGHLEWQRLGRRQHIDVIDHDLDGAGRQRRVDVLRRARRDAPFDGNHALEPYGFGDRERLRIGRKYALRNTVVIPQVDEQQLAVIPLAVDPARQRRALPDVLGTKRVAGVRPV
jgi:hypothetical protein